jgi:hypothetical protein
VNGLRGQLIGRDATLTYLFGGMAVLTLLNPQSGNRFTYRVLEPDVQRNPLNPVFFVHVLTGRDNTRDYRYLGTIFSERLFRVGRGVSPAQPAVRAFAWWFTRLSNGTSIAPVEAYHEGHCGRCGRRLTVPESVQSGFGPECTKLRERRAG